MVLILAGVLRIAAANGDLHIDEIWSWWFVKNVTRTLPSILALRHDNNHIFNTFIMFVLGTEVPGICYRLPAVLAAIGSVVLAGRLAARHGGQPGKLIAWLLFGGSYLQVIYGSEARGYAYSVFFAFFAWETLQRLVETNRWRDAALFAASCCLGFLSHLTFVYAYAGFCAWSLLSWLGKPSRKLVAAHLLPLLTAGWLQLFFIGGIFSPRMAIGGGPEFTLLDAVISTLSLIAGGPLSGDISLFVAMAVLLMMIVGMISVWQHDRLQAICYAAIILLGPAAVLIVTGHALIYPRYFLIPASFALLVISSGLVRWWQASRGGRIGVVILLGGYLFFNGWWIVDLLNHGRGDYSQALRWMASEDSQGPITVSSDHDFRNGFIVDYYGSRLGPDVGRVRYVEQRSIPPEGTMWVIVHNFENDPPPPEIINGHRGQRYQQEKVFRSHSLSGYNWWLYRRVR